MAGVRMLADEAIRDGRQVTLLFGAASAREVYPSTLLPDEVEYVVATDDGSLGHHGFVTELVPTTRPGPTRRSPAGRTRCSLPSPVWSTGRRERLGSRSSAGSGAAGSRIRPDRPHARRKAFLQVSMEQTMGCAVGTCLGCVVMGASGTPQRVCREGPVFAADEVAWDGRLAARHGRGLVVMKARKRVVTSSGRPRGANRRPTVRTVKSAIVAAPKSRGPVVGIPRGPAPGSVGEAATDRAESLDLSVDLGRGLVLQNPILVASGTFGYGVEYGEVVDVQRLGAICSKGTTLKARIGNVTPRVTETPGGMLNSIGLQNPGIDAVIAKYAPIWRGWQVPVLVNVAGESIGDYVEVVRRLDGVPGVAGVELNLSCPNVGKGGLQFALDAEAAGAVTAAVRRATDLPLLVKLSPNVADVRPIARAIADAGADALTAVNTLSGIAVAASRDTAAARGHLRRALGAGAQAGRAADRVRGRPGRRHPDRRDRRRGVDSTTCSTSSRSARSPSRSGTAIFADPTLPVRLIDELARSAADAASGRTGHWSGPRCRGGPGRRRRRGSSTAPSRSRPGGSVRRPSAAASTSRGRPRVLPRRRGGSSPRTTVRRGRRRSPIRSGSRGS